MPDLTDDLICRQLPNESHLSRGTEIAAARTADLRGHTDGVPLAVLEEDRLDQRAIVQLQQILLGAAVRADLMRQTHRRAWAELLRWLRDQDTSVPRIWETLMRSLRIHQRYFDF